MIDTGKRVTLFAGHYGSGKTNVAVNYARLLRRAGARVALADLDIVNPYFRTQDSAALLKREGIELVVSQYANTNVDFPALPKGVYALVDERDVRVVMDIGGDDRGALALGRYVDDIRAENDYDMLAVVNAARPLTRTVADTLEVLREIAAAARLPFTGVVNNTNLGPDTTAQTVLAARAYADEIAAALGVAVRFTCVEQSLAAAVSAACPAVFPLDLQKRIYMHD